MSKTRVMLIGALPVGAGYGANPTYVANGPSPSWRTTYMPPPATVRDFPQNPLRPTSEAGPFAMFSSGTAPVALDVHMLQGLRGLGRLGRTSFGNVGPTGPDLNTILDPTIILSSEDMMGLSPTQRLQAACARNPEYVAGAFAATRGALSLMGAAVGGYHGWKRNKSGWSAAGYALAGLVFPIITTGVGLAQGLAQPKR